MNAGNLAQLLILSACELFNDRQENLVQQRLRAPGDGMPCCRPHCANTGEGLMPQAREESYGAPRHASDPAVSVVMPSYNTAKYISEALDSVFSQTLPAREVFVINDGSPDTEELERVLEPYRERIIYLRQENLGPSIARNTAILKARGEYIAFLDSDDVWLPDYLSAQLKILQEDPGLALVYADTRLFGDAPEAGQTWMQMWPSSHPVTFVKVLTMQCAMTTSCIVARKQPLIDAGLFDPRFFRSEDYDLWLRLLHKGERFTYQEKVLARRRLHGSSLAADTKKLFESQIEVYQKLLSTLRLSPEESAAIKEQMARCYAALALQQGKQQIMAGQFDQAAEALRRANDYYRSHKLQFALLSLRFAPRLMRHLYHLRHRLVTRGMTATV